MLLTGWELVEQLAEARWERDVAALRGMEGGQ